MQMLTTRQEFSIEIPDKEADAIHSGMSLASKISSHLTAL